MTPEVCRWYPLLRRLLAAGWQRTEFGSDTGVEQVWRRGGTRNLQQITLNLSGWSVAIDGRTYSSLVPELGDAWSALTVLGAFDPAPERIDWRRAA